MITRLSSRISLFITANTEKERLFWTGFFCDKLVSCTVTQCVGYWKGEKEPCSKIEHACEDAEHVFYAIAKDLAKYKHEAAQYAVAVRFNNKSMVIFDTCDEITNY